MVLLYTLWVLALGALARWFGRRAARAEQKYSAAALAAQKAVRTPVNRPGNANHDFALVAARRQYELGQLVLLRDRLESKYLRRQARADAASSALGRTLGWKGRLVPYLLGVLDVGLVLAALHYLGLPHGLTEDVVRTWAQTLGM